MRCALRVRWCRTITSDRVTKDGIVRVEPVVLDKTGPNPDNVRCFKRACKNTVPLGPDISSTSRPLKSKFFILEVVGEKRHSAVLSQHICRGFDGECDALRPAPGCLRPAPWAGTKDDFRAVYKLL